MWDWWLDNTDEFLTNESVESDKVFVAGLNAVIEM